MNIHLAKHPVSRRIRGLGRFRARGFGMLSVIIAAGLILSVTVAVVASTRGSSVASDNSQALASQVIGQANSLLSAYELAVSRGGASASTVKFDSSENVGLFSVTTGVFEPPLVPRAMADTDRINNKWQLGRGIPITGYGPAASNEAAFFLIGVSAQVCGAVNRAMTGRTALTTAADTSSSAPPTGTGVTTLLQLFNVSTAPTLTTSANVTPNNTAGSTLTLGSATVFPQIGCFFLSGPSHYVVYAIAQVL